MLVTDDVLKEAVRRERIQELLDVASWWKGRQDALPPHLIAWAV